MTNVSFLLLTLALTALVRANGLAQACDCGRMVAPCAGYSAADAVFAGRVESVKRVTGNRVVTLSVVEGFRGVTADTVEVLTGPAAERCAVPFWIGREYVVYASRTDGSPHLTTSVCARTREVEDAASDLAYARAVKDGSAPAGHIAGQVLVARRDLNGKSAGRGEPLKDITVRVARDGAVETAVSNQAGDFSVDSRGSGTYEISVDAPARYYADHAGRRVELRDPKACADVDLVLFDNGRVKGRVIDAAGRSVPGLTIELATANLAQRTKTVTDREGRFEIARVPSGRYLLRAGIVPMPQTTRRVTVGAGEIVALDDVRLSAEARHVALSGFVLNADGSPAEGARVYLKGAAENDRIISAPVIADFLGRFVIAAAAGTEYRVFAERADGRRVVSSDELRLMAADGVKPLRLVLQRRY